MRTFVTDATPDDLAALAGVKWRKPTLECVVRFGTWQGENVGVQPCGKLWVVHTDTPQAEKALISYLKGRTVWGAQAWTEKTGADVPHIAGGGVAELVDGAAAVAVDELGKVTHLDKLTAAAKLATAIDAGKVEP